MSCILHFDLFCESLCGIINGLHHVHLLKTRILLAKRLGKHSRVIRRDVAFWKCWKLQWFLGMNASHSTLSEVQIRRLSPPMSTAFRSVQPEKGQPGRDKGPPDGFVRERYWIGSRFNLACASEDCL